MKQSRFVGIAAALLLAAAHPCANAQQFVNGDFEIPSLAYVGFQSGFTSGWTITGCGGTITTVAMQESGYPAPTHGLQLGMYCSSASIRQSLALTPGHYQVTFKAMGNTSYPGVAVKVSMNGATIGQSMAIAGATWNSYATQVFQVIAGGSNEFTFATTDPAQYGYVYIDEIQITPVAAPTVTFVNPGFESPALAPAQGGAFNAWTLVGGSGMVLTSTGMVASGYPPTPEGGQFGLYASNSSLQQSLFLPTNNYRISFKAMGNFAYPGGTVKLTMDGAQIGASIPVTVGAWTEYTTPLFPVFAGTRVFSFGAANPAIWSYVYIDDIRITAFPNNAPTVNLTAPVSMQNFSRGAPITLRATASDSDGSVQSVTFYNGAATLATVTTGSGIPAVYTYVWTNASDGVHTTMARATDNLGASTFSAPANVIVTCDVNVAPTVSLTAPANGQTFAAPASTTLAATASDPDGIITRVEFFEGATKIGEATSAPYTLNVKGVAAGTYNVTAKATDACGAVTTSNVATVTVINCASGVSNPAISLVAPYNGQTFTAPADIAVVATASDPDGDLAKVEFFSDGNKIGERTAAPFTLTLFKEVPGTRTLWAKATDICGLTTTTPVTTITKTQPLFTSVKDPECVGGAFTTGGQYLDPNNGVVPNSYSMLMRWQGNLASGSVNGNLSANTGFGFAATASPFSAPPLGPLAWYQRGVNPEVPPGTGHQSNPGTPGTQLYCNGGGMLLNTWEVPHVCIEGGGYNDMYGYAWGPGNQPDAFVSRFSDGTVYRETDLLLQANMGVATFTQYLAPEAIRTGEPNGEFDLFAYVYDAAHPALRPIVILGGAYNVNASPGGGYGVDYPGGVWYIYGAAGGDTPYTTNDPASAAITAISNGHGSAGSPFFRIRVSPQNWRNAIDAINHDVRANAPPTGYSMNVADYRIQYAGVIAEIVPRQTNGGSSCVSGYSADGSIRSLKRDQVSLGVNFFNVGVYRRY